MAANQCPVCRRPLSMLRNFLRPAWSRWRCETCNSLLGMSIKRRLLGVAPYAVFIVMAGRFLGTSSLGTLMVLCAIVASGLAIFTLVDAIVVLERCGFRCRSCGYDLRGQINPSCPECGCELDESERHLMAQADPAAAVEVLPRANSGWLKIVLALLVLILSIGVVWGFAAYRAATAAAAAAQGTPNPPPAASTTP